MPQRTTIAATAPRVSTRLIIILGFLAVLGPLTIDLYLPAFPQLQESLSTTPARVQLTLSAATLGFALGQLVVGPWSDTIGRRRPLLIATAVHIVASVAIAAAPDITWVLALRVLQGAGAAGGGVVAMAMMRDVAEGRHLIRGLARVALFTGIAPVIAPFLGAQLMVALDWRGLFGAVAVYGVAVLGASMFLIPETLALERRLDRSDRRAVWRGYRTLLMDRRFVGIALIGGMMVSSVFAYLSSSSFLLQQQYGLTPQLYGVVSAANAVAFVVGTQMSAFIAQRRSPQHVLVVVLPAMAVTGFSLGLIAQAWSGLTPVLGSMLVFMALAGACGPCLGALGLADHATRAGTAAALLGAVNFGLAGLASPIVGAIGITTMTPLGVVMGIAMTTATAAFWLLVRNRPRDRVIARQVH
ncbi:Bcr/CflA family efflux MFS transporter [Agreia sp. Leaf283]|uniref:Bcr/CflA family efflux MFS transporter n=1 Tax=Agreia sp. Leaf283 TaxID=1736321 RepID=UPI0006FD843F|nr:Bcr/CflA family efflux MFS transporter [Agreia sp. Leaf283]KQP56011.1 MFS transporter [Agreia sp. Leaf283]